MIHTVSCPARVLEIKEIRISRSVYFVSSVVHPFCVILRVLRAGQMKGKTPAIIPSNVFKLALDMVC